MREVTYAKNKLQKFGLSEKQADIYVFLLRHGDARISDVTRVLNIPRSSVYESLKGLFELGLAEEIIENSYRKVKAYPIRSIKHQLDEKIARLTKQTSELALLEKSLDALPGIIIQPPTVVRYYKGKAGAQQLFWNTLKAKNTLYVYSGWGRGRYVGIKYYQNFVAESLIRNVQERVITNPTNSTLDSMRQHTGTSLSRTDLSNIRAIPEEQITFKGDTLMYDNIYAQIFLKDDEINGFEIESKQFIKTQRAIFETLWESAQPITELLDNTSAAED